MTIIKQIMLVLTHHKTIKSEPPIMVRATTTTTTKPSTCRLVLLLVLLVLVIGSVIVLLFAPWSIRVDSSIDNHVDNESKSFTFTNNQSHNAQSNLIDDIFWSSSLDRRLPKGFTALDDANWAETFHAARVVNVERGCGRMQNRLLTLSTGEQVCARYRKNNDQLQGEFFTFVLARLLGLRNVPPSLLLDYTRNDRWSAVANDLDAQAGWESRRPIVLTRFVANLQPAYIPASLQSSSRRHLDRGTVDSLVTNGTSGQLLQLVQWSDLIVLDYLTANLDRIVNNMINERWNPQMMASPAHNLLRASDSELLLFLDNESGLFHGYRLLGKYESLHRSMLDALCLFRRPTIQRLEMLASMSEPELTVHLHRSIRTAAALGPGLSSSSSSLLVFPHNNLVILRRRMRQVVRQVDNCRRQAKSMSS